MGAAQRNELLDAGGNETQGSSADELTEVGGADARPRQVGAAERPPGKGKGTPSAHLDEY